MGKRKVATFGSEIENTDSAVKYDKKEPIYSNPPNITSLPTHSKISLLSKNTERHDIHIDDFLCTFKSESERTEFMNISNPKNTRSKSRVSISLDLKYS